MSVSIFVSGSQFCWCWLYQWWCQKQPEAQCPLQSPWHQQTVGYQGDMSAVVSLLPQAGCSHFKLSCSAATVTCSTGLSVKHCPVVENLQWLNGTHNKWNVDFNFGVFFRWTEPKLVLWFIQLVGHCCCHLCRAGMMRGVAKPCKWAAENWTVGDSSVLWLHCRFYSDLSALIWVVTEKGHCKLHLEHKVPACQCGFTSQHVSLFLLGDDDVQFVAGFLNYFLKLFVEYCQ